MARKEKKFYLHPYTISFDSDGAHLLEETSIGDRGYTIPRWKFAKVKAALKIGSEMDLYTFLRFWPQEQGEALQALFSEYASERVVYWDQDDFDRIWQETR